MNTSKSFIGLLVIVFVAFGIMMVTNLLDNSGSISSNININDLAQAGGSGGSSGGGTGGTSGTPAIGCNLNKKGTNNTDNRTCTATSMSWCVNDISSKLLGATCASLNLNKACGTPPPKKRCVFVAEQQTWDVPPTVTCTQIGGWIFKDYVCTVTQGTASCTDVCIEQDIPTTTTSTSTTPGKGPGTGGVPAGPTGPTGPRAPTTPPGTKGPTTGKNPTPPTTGGTKGPTTGPITKPVPPTTTTTSGGSGSKKNCSDLNNIYPGSRTSAYCATGACKTGETCKVGEVGGVPTCGCVKN